LDLEQSPFIVFYEATRACDLACAHCRACAFREPHPNQLDFFQAQRLIEQLSTFPQPPMLVLTGGDPLKRDDIVELTAHGTACGLHVSLAPAATPLASADLLQRLRDAGLQRLAVSIDGHDPATHDALRRVPGSFREALALIARARAAQIPVQVNTTITRHNAGQVRSIGQWLAQTEGVVLWSVFFLVPVGRAEAADRVRPADYERLFAQLHRLSRETGLAIKTTEAPFYRRYVLQHHGTPQTGPRRGPLGINDGKGVMFISHVGQVFPSGFLPIDCGRFPRQSVVDLYQKHPLFRALRDPDQLGGKCGACEYRDICGGSRSRAYALTRDPLAAEPDCAYLPRAWRTHALDL
jgi:MoaA/NifB/PqqE/SkfB family radical SAM enzyme